MSRSWSRPDCIAVPASLVLVLASAGVARAGEAPAPTAAASPALAQAPSGISVHEDSARWESGYGEKFFQVVGTITNGSAQPVGAVLIHTDLLDDGGKVVASVESWNGRAEALGDLRAEAARAELVVLAPGPIGPGATDRFRATFIADETPKFARHQVRVVETLPPS